MKSAPHRSRTMRQLFFLFITLSFFTGCGEPEKPQPPSTTQLPTKPLPVERKVCDLHQTVMQQVEVPVLYGKPALDPKHEQYPNAAVHILGGCIVSPQSESTHVTHRCSKCYEVYQELNPKEVKTHTPQTYTVRPGDSLWTVSKKTLGAGTRYKDIVEFNQLKSDDLREGQVLLIPPQ